MGRGGARRGAGRKTNAERALRALGPGVASSQASKSSGATLIPTLAPPPIVIADGPIDPLDVFREICADRKAPAMARIAAARALQAARPEGDRRESALDRINRLAIENMRRRVN